MNETLGRALRGTYRLTVGAGLSLASYVFLGLIPIAAVLTAMVIGAGMLPETVLMLRRFAGFKRRQVAEWSGSEIPEAYAPLTGGFGERIRAAWTDPQTWRDLRWLLLHLGYGLALFILALVVWPFALLVDGAWYGLLRQRPVLLPLIARLADLDAAWSRRLLSPAPGAGLAERVAALTATRADAIAAHGAELRRIERDLHDGAQARLVALSMRVGLARRQFDRDPDGARRLLGEAQDQAEQALAELRQVVRGIYPPILTDRGLVGAVRALAASSGLTVTVEVDGLTGPDDPRPPAAIEAAGYFVVAEALTNAARHSGATRASVRMSRATRALRIVVRDEGRGGADEAGGSGLLGIRRRVAALDGAMTMTSPTGGPTTIEVELPCVW